MIEFSQAALTLSLPVTRALLAFASTDPKLAHLHAIGIDRAGVCASDGHTAVRFESEATLGIYNGRYFSRELVEQAYKDAGRTGPVTLVWAEAESRGFPRVHEAEPTAPVGELVRPIQLDARYLGRLELVTLACRRDKQKGDTEAPPCPGVLLTSLASELDPIRYQIGGSAWHAPTAHTAWVTIMPMRQASVTPRQVASFNRKRRAEAQRAAASSKAEV